MLQGSSTSLEYNVGWITPVDECPLGGAAAYKDAVVVDSKQTTITASHFRTFHTNLNHQKDYIGAYKAARRISKEIEENIGGKVFPYSVFYIFFDQYISLVPLTFTLLGSALGAICIASAILLGSITTAILLMITVAMVVVDVAGVMVLWGVSLNAVSLVNLVICVGIGVEFCAHIAKSFTVPSPAAVSHVSSRMGKSTEREERACGALVSVGASVWALITVLISGIQRDYIDEICWSHGARLHSIEDFRDLLFPNLACACNPCCLAWPCILPRIALNLGRKKLRES